MKKKVKILFSVFTGLLIGFSFWGWTTDPHMIAEVLVRVKNLDGTPKVTTLELYKVTEFGGKLVDTRTSLSTMSLNDNSNATYELGGAGEDINEHILKWGYSYRLVIQNKYLEFSLSSAGPGSTPTDFYIEYQNGFTFENSDNIHGVKTGDVITYNVNIKNSFPNGKLKIDDVEYLDTGSGINKSFKNVTFPHTIEAVNNQPNDGAIMGFRVWEKDKVTMTQGQKKTLSDDNCGNEYKAYYRKYFHQHFQNYLIGIGNLGYIKINNIAKQLPAPQELIAEFSTVKLTAPTQVYNGIEYTFSHWADGGSSSFSRNVEVLENKTYVAHYSGRPSNAARSLQFNTTEAYGTNIKLYWNDNPNINVDYYEIWRHKKDQSPVKIATVNRGVEFYEDTEYKRTANANTTTLLFYDVRGHYSVENTFASEDFRSAYGETTGPLPTSYKDENLLLSEIAMEETIETKENKIVNYPNPFNPSTKIEFTLKEAGDVKVEVYDMLGRKIKTLENSHKEAGSYSTVFNANGIASGIYILVMQTGQERITKKIVFTK